MTSKYKSKIMKDIIGCLEDNGPLTARSISRALGKSYATPQRVALYLHAMDGREVHKEDVIGCTSIWAVGVEE